MSAVLPTRIVKRFGDIVAMAEVHTEVKSSEFLVVLGPSG